MPAPPPKNFTYDSQNKILSWDGVPDVDEYEVVFKLLISPSWSIAYNGGTNTECSFIHEPGVYNVKGKSKKEETWGEYSKVYDINVT